MRNLQADADISGIGGNTEGSLNVAIDHLIENVSTKVLGKRKLEEDNSVAVEDKIGLLYNMFNRLY